VRDAAAGDPLPELVDAALEEDDEAQPASVFDPAFLQDVEADLERLRRLSAMFDRLASVGDPKLEALAEVLRTTPARKVAVFCSYADTARYVAEAISRDPGRFGDREMEVVIGTETDAGERVAKLERFCPRSVTGDPDFEPDREVAFADEALGVGRGPQVRRRLAELRRRASAEGLSALEVANAIVEIVKELGLRPEPQAPEAGRPITEADLGVVCFQVVFGAAAGGKGEPPGPSSSGRHPPPPA
jgi:hypothetical protein